MNCPVCQLPCTAVTQKDPSHVRHHCMEHETYGFTCHTFGSRVFAYTIVDKQVCFSFVSDNWSIDTPIDDKFKAIKEGKGTISPDDAYKLLLRYKNLRAFI